MNELICYCFGHTAEDIRKDVKENGRSTIMEKSWPKKDRGDAIAQIPTPREGDAWPMSAVSRNRQATNSNLRSLHSTPWGKKSFRLFMNRRNR